MRFDEDPLPQWYSTSLAMFPKPRIVIVDDEQKQTISFAKLFGDEFEVIQINDPSQVAKVVGNSISVAIVDECMGAVSGIDVLSDLRLRHPDIIRILITGYGDEYLAAAVNKARIFHYVQKPFDASVLRVVLHEAVREFGIRQWGQQHSRRLEQERDALTAHPAGRVALRDTLGFSTLIGKSSSILGLIERSRKVVDEKISILINGETGTGKDVLARAIHFEGSRKHFHSKNCSELNEQLAHADLFGVAKGAFTGAIARPGLCELADQGTLFLDEIAELPLVVQARLLTFLDRLEFQPVGSNAIKTTDVRLIAATNKNLEVEVAAGRFRQDLYFRLLKFHITLPALRERVEDIPPLAEYFARLASAESGRSASISTEALDVLRQYHFPGNVRELRAIVEAAIIESGGPIVEPQHLPTFVLRAPGKKTILQQRDDDLIDKVQKVVSSSRTKEEAAKELGISDRYLRKLRRGKKSV